MINLTLPSSSFLSPKIFLFDSQIFPFKLKLSNTGNFVVSEIKVFIYVLKDKKSKILLEEVSPQVKIDVGKHYIFEYFYWHKSCYERLEFKIYFGDGKEKKEEEFLLKPYLCFSKDIQSMIPFEIKNITYFPIVYSNFIYDLGVMDNKISPLCNVYYCSGKYAFLLEVTNTQQSKMKVEILNENERLNPSSPEHIQITHIIDGYKNKVILFEVNSTDVINKVFLCWNISEKKDLCGKCVLTEILGKFNKTFEVKEEFLFEIFEKKEEEKVKVWVKLKNISKVTRHNLKLFLYIYEGVKINDSKNFAYNNNLSSKLFIEGNYSITIEKLGQNDEFNYDLSVFPIKGEQFNFSALVLDKEKNDVFLCPDTLNIII